jgi:hypothetical protein
VRLGAPLIKKQMLTMALFSAARLV